MDTMIWPVTPVDATLTQEGKAADAKATGDALHRVIDVSDQIIALSDVKIGDIAAYVSGNVASIYVSVDCQSSKSAEFILQELPQPFERFVLVQCCDYNGSIIGAGWVYPDGRLLTPQNFDKTGYFYACYITRSNGGTTL